MSGDRIAARFRVSGRVQGVGFRYFVMQQARKIGVAGWVKNLSTGEVEVHVEAPDPKLRRLELALHQGPVLSRVDAVVETPAAFENAATFEIRY